MIVSIRKFLVFYLLAALVVTNFLTAIGNYFLDQKDIEKHLDALLRQAAFSFAALLTDDLNEDNLAKLQANLDSFQLEANNQGSTPVTTSNGFVQKYQFQVWNHDGELLLRSAGAPLVHLAASNDGFSDKVINHHLWRSYALKSHASDITIEVAEQYDVRNRLARAITQDDIYIILLTYPIAGILIWMIIGRALSSIDRVTKEVSHRLPQYLEPVDTEFAPIEILPLLEELNGLFAKLQQALEREKRFSADAAHELRTPLAALKTQLQVALNTKDSVEQEGILRNVLLATDRAAHVVQQLLTLSRLEPESNTLSDICDLDLVKLTQEVMAMMVPSALEKQIELSLNNDETKIFIQGNATALSILLRNLIDNAIRYTPNEGRVDVFIQQKDNCVLLKVQDNGPGVPEELRKRVFERFYRVLGNQASGSGLGLAIVAQITQLHGASVSLNTPENNQGLEVVVSFPV